MARGLAISHSSNARPAGQPAANYREVTPERHAVARDRNIRRINPTPVAEPVPDASTVCTATKANGDPCRARPVTDTDLCIFHT